ncbi:DUF3575 domain-containing protein [Flavobacterium psychrotolerans]|uniref:DUF3575 domain-containing protein n=1 Tax=Flavobacterium psychrotolerans TaxID=2169410 RepID=A0A2U1JGX2_9FLAO|nr:DUF3575 domain-containing protein [Flavobacterium psychrotolerans]PWA04371.1 hypothetical protein DB895_11500 [Flavobacterium psychrotolerans]
MKKFLFILLLFVQCMNAQDTMKSGLSKRHNEFRVNILTLIATSKLNLTYERFLSKNYSLGLSGNYSNSKKVNDDFDQGFRNTFQKYEITPFARYNFTTSINRYYFAEVFVSANGGNFRETVRLVDENNYGYYAIQKTTYTDLAIGASAGYKMYFKEKFGIEIIVGIGRNLINRAKSSDFPPRVGLSFGYRF